MNKLIKSYEKSIQKNINELQSIIRSLGMPAQEFIPAYKQVLVMSSKNISKKWITGRKYARTKFVQQAFSKNYPTRYVELSLMIDAMVNILDDFYDEKMTQDEKTLYLIEYLRIFAIYGNEKTDKSFQKKLGRYFNELITLAVAEKIFLGMIKKEKKAENVIAYSANLLLCRAMDIDIFNDIALQGYKNSKLAKNIKQAGRAFRAINLLKKDIDDIPYDKKHGLESVVIYALDNKRINFVQYSEGLVSALIQTAQKPTRITLKSKATKPLENFYKMAKKEEDEIRKIIQKKYNK